MEILGAFLLTLAVGVPAILVLFAEETRPTLLRAKIHRKRSRMTLPEGLQGGHDLQVEDWLNGTAIFVPSQVTFDNLRSAVESHRTIAWGKAMPYSPDNLRIQAVEVFFKLGAHDRLMQVVDDEARRTSTPSSEFIEYLRTALNGVAKEAKDFVYSWVTATEGRWLFRSSRQTTGAQQQEALLAMTSKELASLLKWKHSKNNNQIRKALTKGQVPL